MRLNVLLAAFGLSLVTACGTTTEASPFAQPNSLMGEEIDRRIAAIPFQQREELVENLIWLTQTGEQAIPSLLTALESESPKVRSNCAWVLGQMGDRRTISYLQGIASDPDERVRLEVARTLVLMGDMAQTGTLIEGLDSDRKEVRYMCHEALKTATRRDFGYDHLALDMTARDTATYKWRQWWGEVSGDPYFAASYASEKGIDIGDPAVPMGIPAAPGGETMQPIDPDAQDPSSASDPGSQPESSRSPDATGQPGVTSQPGTAPSQPDPAPKAGDTGGSGAGIDG